MSQIQSINNFINFCESDEPSKIFYLFNIKLGSKLSVFLRTLAKRCIDKYKNSYSPNKNHYLNTAREILLALPSYPNIEDDLVLKENNKEFYMQIIKYVGEITLLQRFKEKEITSLNSITNMPKTLDRQTFINVLEEDRAIWITDKMDGQRCVLDVNNGYGIYVTGKGFSNIFVDFKQPSRFIFDCELYEGNFYAFDIIFASEYQCQIKNKGIFVNEICCSNCPLKYRLELLEKLLPLNTGEKPLRPTLFRKNILKYRDAKSNEIIKTNLDLTLQKKPYYTDGIIFILYNQPFIKDGIKKFSNNTYMNTTNYKWKPLKDLSIDFLCLKCPKDLEDKLSLKNSYILCSSAGKLKDLNLPSYESKNNIVNDLINYAVDRQVKTVSKKHIPFMPSTKPLAFLYEAELEDLDNKIVEMKYEDQRWKFMRFRSDKSDANNFNVAEQTWQQYKNPLLLEDLYKPKKDILSSNYFKISENEDMERIRNYNNYIKGKLISAFANEDFVLDLASGKGQDLNKYFKTKTRNLVMTDYDLDAIDELIKRKQNSINDTKVFTTQTNLKSSSNKVIENINNLFKYGNIKNKFDSIFCNLALHYLTETTNEIKNISKVIDYYLKDDGFFVFTSFNKNKVLELTRNGPWKPNNVFYIERINDKRIKVKLPCDNILKEENLIDMEELDRYLGEYGFERQVLNTFGSEFFNTSAEYQKMNDYEKIFVDLYQYVVYIKRPNESYLYNLLFKEAKNWHDILDIKKKKCFQLGNKILGIEYDKEISKSINVIRIDENSSIEYELGSGIYSFILTQDPYNKYSIFLVRSNPGEIGTKHFCIFYKIPKNYLIMSAGELIIDVENLKVTFNLKSGSITSRLLTVGNIFMIEDMLELLIEQFKRRTENIFKISRYSPVLNTDEIFNYEIIYTYDPLIPEIPINEKDVKKYCEYDGVEIKEFLDLKDCEFQFIKKGKKYC